MFRNPGIVVSNLAAASERGLICEGKNKKQKLPKAVREESTCQSHYIVEDDASARQRLSGTPTTSIDNELTKILPGGIRSSSSAVDVPSGSSNAHFPFAFGPSSTSGRFIFRGRVSRRL
jgi:hypothetical protein